MWCLVYLEKASPNALAGVLKARTFDVHIAPDIDDLLDALWYHGSAVGCIVLETHASEGLNDVLQALEDWPELEVLVFSPAAPQIGAATRHHRFEQTYSLRNVQRWLSGAQPGALDGSASS